ncbi:hypothetical protein C8C96_4777 [Acidovorax sp. 100]|uniref:hypothetical protein n=1 Tax=Acidovorax sp. 100 TaxID=2135635 RepID=UPI000F0D6F3D|nr:hypothetical protein [Acidovorax sp. 100]RMA56360.1 hypothetical protein C8C96_4777 [Acidovorax sp. 100]
MVKRVKAERVKASEKRRFLGLTDGQIGFAVVFALWLLLASTFADLSLLTEGFKR